jgi:hypothetical protein
VGLLIPIRRELQHYINIRPVKTLDGVRSPLACKEPIDILIVRENNEGEHSEVGGRVYRGVPHVTAVQETIFTRQGVSGAAHYAVSLALSQPSMEGTSPMFCPMVTDEFTALDLHGQRRNRRGGHLRSAWRHRSTGSLHPWNRRLKAGCQTFSALAPPIRDRPVGQAL